MSRLQKYLKNSKILDFPGFRQTYEWNCGTTALNMVLAYFGNDINEVELIKATGSNKETGTPIEGIKKAAKQYGLKFKEGSFTTEDLKEHIDKGWPTLIMIQAWSRQDNPDWKNEWDQGHYVDCVGYDEKRLYFADPMAIKRVFLTDSALNGRWHGWDDNGKKIRKWGIVFTNKSSYSYEDLEEMG